MTDPQVQRAGIVLAGAFNPAIFTPDWLHRVELIKEAERDAADVTVVHQELTVLSISSLILHVGPTRLAVATEESPFVKIQDFTTSLIGAILPHTPISAFGINYTEIFLSPTAGHRIALGRQLAPLAPWGEWGKKLESDKLLKVGGLIRLTMKESRPDDRNGHFQVEVMPSNEVDRARAVQLESNDHYEVQDNALQSSAVVAATLISENFEQSLKKASRIYSDIKELCSKVEPCPASI